MDQPRKTLRPVHMVEALIHAGGLRRHGPISVVGTRRRSYGYALLSPPWIWGRGAHNATRRTSSTAF